MTEIRIFPRGPQIDPAILARFAVIAAAQVADAMGRKGVAVGIRPVGRSLSSRDGLSVVGPALTVLTRPGDNLAVHKALDLAQPGDVVVIDAQRDPYSSILGDLLTYYAETRGVAALVIDGAVRDEDGISAGALPVFARSISHIGPTKAGPGDISVPVTIGGTVVRDGDLIIGDSDGITIVAHAEIESVLELSEAVVSGEIESRSLIKAGQWDRTWIESAATITTIGDTESTTGRTR